MFRQSSAGEDAEGECSGGGSSNPQPPRRTESLFIPGGRHDTMAEIRAADIDGQQSVDLAQGVNLSRTSGTDLDMSADSLPVYTGDLTVVPSPKLRPGVITA